MIRIKWSEWLRRYAPPASWMTIRRIKRQRPINDRIVGVLVVGLGLLGVVWLRCLWLQVLGARRYAAYATAQHQVSEILQPRRGVIVDRFGQPLAVSVPAPSVFANARQVTDKLAVAHQLAHLVDRTPQAIQQQLQKDKGFVWVARQVDPQLTPKLQLLRDEGVGLTEEVKRLYPHGSLAAPVLGFVNIDGQGLEGLELTLNRSLQGHAGVRSTLRDAKGDVLIGPWTVERRPVDGASAVLTVDTVVQEVAEDTLQWGMAKYHAKGGSIIVMDPQTGAIRALAVRPSYNPNAPADEPADHRRNRAVTDMFEPGSIFKIVTAAALLEEHRITPDDMIFCEQGAYPTVAHHILHDHTPHGMLSFHDVIKLSSNIGTAKAAQRLKPEELYRYIQAFGFGRPTGIDLPGEVGGMVNPPSTWSKLSPFIIPIGQEVAVTPIQLAVMTAVVANGGWRVQPHVVERIETADRRRAPAAAIPPPVRVISQTTAETLQEILTSVVESGTGELATVQGLIVAGKTGTAQKLEPNGRYSHSRFVASFVGFGPVPDSSFVMVVSMDEPRPLYFGGVVSAPMFKRMVERLAGYWELERTATPSLASVR